MDLDIEPQPSPEEREAIEIALRRLIEGPYLPSPYRSAWRAEGIREAVEDQAAEAGPRNSFGATRA